MNKYIYNVKTLFKYVLRISYSINLGLNVLSKTSVDYFGLQP
jgi:hypothetical protein